MDDFPSNCAPRSVTRRLLLDLAVAAAVVER
jgi:hypothetical protein